MNSEDMARKNTLNSIVIPDLIQPSQPGALLRRSRLGNPDSEKCLLDSRFRGNDREEGLPIGSINHTRLMGVTLVELVVAICILIASLTVLLICFSRVTHNAETARRELKAMHIARTEIEQFRSTNYSAITTYAATNLSDSFFVPLGGQKQCIVVSNNSGYKTISLTVSWRSTVGSPTISQTFNTIICNTN